MHTSAASKTPVAQPHHALGHGLHPAPNHHPAPHRGLDHAAGDRDCFAASASRRNAHGPQEPPALALTHPKPKRKAKGFVAWLKASLSGLFGATKGPRAA